ncbi:DUF3800 domain-containing protein [Hymenobacter sp. BT635]|uniref:DUF3800 domain-containing protein n=1 Tax=Hymenobacter nitidus TaxID=2880929 RepID=A0ABS8AK26_9BACT|nr:DUF3800 domain-containing protein [Hymenobacter nitidus]MCB2380399.1 DUF3800 domain-containing protein [Hymenobacter nitidus]
MKTNIYCDEAGYTGDDLQEANQPYFTYAGVALEHQEATDIIGEIRQRVRTQAPELKGKQLYNHSGALGAIEHLVKRLAGRGAYVVHNKAFALGAKFFEYALEPALAANNRFFYQSKFHLFIANLMHLFLSSGDTDAETLLNHFMKRMRRVSDDAEDLFPHSLQLSDNPQSILTDITRLLRSPEVQAANREELDSISDEEGRIRWILDLSVTSATSVLRHLSATYGELLVTLDDSKPLVASAPILDALGSGPLVAVPVEWADGLPFNFQLAAPIRFANSNLEPGLQVADMLASVVNLAMRDRSTARAQQILELVLPLACKGSIIPATEYIDLTTEEARFNINILAHLVARAEAGVPLLG